MTSVFAYLKAIPLLVLVVVAYFLVTIGGPGVLDRTAFGGVLPSGAVWSLHTGDLLVAAGLLVLFIELLKSTRSSTLTMIDQMLSMILFAVLIILFLLAPPAGTGTFVLLTLMSLVDVLAGFIIMLSTARRDVTIDTGL